MRTAGTRAPRGESSSRLYALLFLASFLTIVGSGIGSRPLFAMGSSLIIVVLAQAFRSRKLLNYLRITRSHVPRCLEGETLYIQLRVENQSTSHPYLVGIADRCAAIGGSVIHSLVVELPAFATAEVPYHITCDYRRGYFVLGPTTVTVPDELGIFRWRTLRNVHTDLLVCPRPLSIEKLPLLGIGTLPHVGIETVRHSGRSEVFAGVREFREGDPFRFVHWPTTLRTRKLHVKEFDRSVVTHVSVFIDLFATGETGIGNVTSVEQRLRVAATLAASAIENCHFVRLIAAKVPSESTRSAGGKLHLQSLMQWLATQSARGVGSLEDVLISELSSIRRGSTVALVLSSINIQLPRLCKILQQLRSRQVHFVAAVVEDRSYLKRYAYQTSLFEASLPMEEIATELQMAGCTVYTLWRDAEILHSLGAAV